MFYKKTKCMNDVFGEVKRGGLGWTTSDGIQIVLWSKIYELSLKIVDIDNSGISKLQEDTYMKFKENLVENQKNIEKIVAKYFNTMDIHNLTSNFIPYNLQINTNGECALIAQNMEDGETDDADGLAIIIYPKMAIFTNDMYIGYVYASGDRDIQRELYGD